MNERYLFRGKHGDRWVIGALFETTSGNPLIMWISDDKKHVHEAPVLAETIGQCTGTKDKGGEGSLIFEHDIVKDTEGKILLVCWLNNGFQLAELDECWKLTECYQLADDDTEGVVEIEIIGNIHDNPELLEGVV